MTRRQDHARRAVIAAMAELETELNALAWAEHKVGNTAGSVAYFAAASKVRHFTEEPGMEIP